LPSFSDKDGDSVSMTVQMKSGDELPYFIATTLYFQPRVGDAGKYKITITLEDANQSPRTTEEDIIVTILEKIVEPEPVPDDIKDILVNNEEERDLVTAEIKDITARGEVSIEFSESIKPIYNVTELAQFVYVNITREGRYRNDLLGNWEILAVSEVELLLKLHFSDYTLISMGEVRDLEKKFIGT